MNKDNVIGTMHKMSSMAANKFEMGQRLNEVWEEYSDQVLPEEISETNTQALKQAFMAGFHISISVIGQISEKYEEEQGAYMIEGLDGVLREWFESREGLGPL